MFRMPAPRRRIVGVDHLSLPVTDLSVAERFYSEVLEGELIERVDRATWLSWFPKRAAEAESPRRPFHLTYSFGLGPRIQLFLQSQPLSPLDDHPHLALQIAPDALAPMQAHLEACGVPTSGPVAGTRRGQTSLCFLDPFGNHLELVTIGFTESATALPVRDSDAVRLALVYQWPAVPSPR